jgi:hypothetical protein
VTFCVHTTFPLASTAHAWWLVFPSIRPTAVAAATIRISSQSAAGASSTAVQPVLSSHQATTNHQLQPAALGIQRIDPRQLRTEGHTMTVTRDIAATRQRVWDVLANGWTYSGWVVGNSRIRAVDSNWPAPGTRILHSIGAWPAVIDDETVVESSVSGEELVLLAKLRPVAKAQCAQQNQGITVV